MIGIAAPVALTAINPTVGTVAPTTAGALMGALPMPLKAS